MACGVGRHAVPLAERGVEVDGLDLSAAFLDRARERAEEAGVADRTRFVEGDVHQLADADLRHDYDLVACLYISFGYFGGETNREGLAAMADRVAPSGGLVVEVANKEGMLVDFAESGVFEQGGYLVTEQRAYDPDASRIEATRRMFEARGDDYDFAAETAISLRLYAPIELRTLVEDAGLDARCYADYDGETLERESSAYSSLGGRRRTRAFEHYTTAVDMTYVTSSIQPDGYSPLGRRNRRP